MNYKVEFSDRAYKDFETWRAENHFEYLRICELIEAIKINPFNGIGKPEALKHGYTGYWSRRISKEHRLIYKLINPEHLFILECKGHYRNK